MQNETPIPLRQYRDFGQLISTTFQFLRQNWRPLFRAIGVICLPPGLIAGFLIGRSMGDIQRISMGNVEFTGISQGLPMVIGYVLLLLSIIMLIAIVYEYLRAYEKGEHHALGTADLWQRSIAEIGNYIGISLLMGILVVIGTLLCFLPGVYVFVALSLTYIVHAIERKGVIDSMKRSHQLITDRWWETFGLIIILGLIQSVIAYALMIPTMIVSFAIGLNSLDGGQPDQERFLDWYSITMALMMTINMLVTMLTYPIMAVALGLKYYSLVEEKEGLGLRQKIQGFEQA